MPTDRDKNRNEIILLLCAVAVIAGSIGPWAHVWIVTINGTSGDGVFTLGAGVIAAVLAYLNLNKPVESRSRYAGLLLLFGGSAALGAYTWSNLSDLASDNAFAASVGWGLPVITFAGAVGVVASFVQLGALNRHESAMIDDIDY